MGVEIDKLTNSILNTIFGDSFPTDIHLVSKQDIKSTTKKNGWQFNWLSESKLTNRSTYKLTIRNNPDIEKSLEATHIGGHKMVIFLHEALR